MTDLSRLVVLISGSGSNLQAILDACSDGYLSAQVVAVISNKADAYGLQRARKVAIPTVILPFIKGQQRREYDALLAAKVAEFRADYVILAGWMRILTMPFLGRFQNRVINLHPALPGTFPGTHAIERAYESWQQGHINKTGVMVHLVPDEGVDVGPTLATEEIYFKAGESLDDFEARVHTLEHRILVETIRNLVTKK